MIAEQLNFADEVVTNCVANVKSDLSALRKGIFSRHDQLEKSLNFSFDMMGEIRDRMEDLEKQTTRVDKLEQKIDLLLNLISSGEI